MADEQPPVWDGTGRDPWMPDRLAALLDAATAEARMFKAFLRFLYDWLALARERTRAARYDPAVIPGLFPAWWDAMTEYAEHDIVPTMQQGYERVTGDRYGFDGRAAATARALERRNLLVRVADEVYAMVQTEAAKAVNQGISGDALADTIENIFDTTDTPYWENRAVTVARTETLAALNAGRYDGHVYTANRLGGAFERVWVATMHGASADRTRPTHQEADGQRAALDGAFTVGGAALRWPGDPTGPPQEVINCRCTTILVRPGQNTNITRRA